MNVIKMNWNSKRRTEIRTNELYIWKTENSEKQKLVYVEYQRFDEDEFVED